MTKVLAKLLISALALILMAYTGARSVNFIMATLPPERQLLAFFALACLEGGMLGWLYYFLKGAEGAWQRGIAAVLVVIDFAGSAALFTADTLFESAKAGLTAGLAPEEIRMTLLALSGVIAVNVAAKLLCWAMDPKARKERAQSEAFDKIDDLALDKIDGESDRLAEELANEMTAAWKAQTRALYSAKIARLGAGAAYNQPIDATWQEPTPQPQPTRKPAGGLRLPWQKQPTKAEPITPSQPAALDVAALAASVAAILAKPQPKPQPEPTYTPVSLPELRGYAAESTPIPGLRAVPPLESGPESSGHKPQGAA